jgi:hypothetical protein
VQVQVHGWVGVRARACVCVNLDGALGGDERHAEALADDVRRVHVVLRPARDPDSSCPGVCVCVCVCVCARARARVRACVRIRGVHAVLRPARVRMLAHCVCDSLSVCDTLSVCDGCM